MDSTYDLIFEDQTFSAEVVFVGTRCFADNTMYNYTTGSMHFVRAGRAEVVTPGRKSILIEQPALVFFPSACPHRVCAVDDAGFDMVCAFTSFGEGISHAVARSLPECLVLPLDRLAPIGHTLEALFAEAQCAAPGSRQLADRLCEVVLGYLTRHAVQEGHFKTGVLAAASDRRIAAALRAIHTGFQNELQLDCLAREAGMSRSRFVARFRELVGTSPHSYLVNYRIGMAQKLLAGRLPVKTVAGRVGYATASAFVRKFKEVVGVSPAAWAR